MSKVKLGDVANEIRETTTSHEDDTPVVALEHLEPGEITLKEWTTNGNNTFTKCFHKGQMLFGRRRAYLKKAALAPFDGICSGDITVIEAKAERLLPELLPFIIQNDAFFNYAVGKSAGSLSPRVKWEHLKEYEFSLPRLEEQRKLANIFWAMDRTKNAYKNLIAKTDELVKSQFSEMFGDIGTEHYKFETRKLGEVANVGSSHRVFTTEFVNSGIPFYRGTEIGELANGQKPSEPYFISEEHYHRLACDETKPQIGDLLMPSICNKGQVWMVNTNEPFYYKDGRVLCISPDRTVFNPTFLQYFMKEKTLVEYPKMGSGSTFAEFKIFLLKDIDVLIPPLPLQNQFAAFIDHLDKSKFALEKTLGELQAQYKMLLKEHLG